MTAARWLVTLIQRVAVVLGVPPTSVYLKGFEVNDDGTLSYFGSYAAVSGHAVEFDFESLVIDEDDHDLWNDRMAEIVPFKREPGDA